MVRKRRGLSVSPDVFVYCKLNGTDNSRKDQKVRENKTETNSNAFGPEPSANDYRVGNSGLNSNSNDRPDMDYRRDSHQIPVEN